MDRRYQFFGVVDVSIAEVVDVLIQDFTSFVGCYRVALFLLAVGAEGVQCQLAPFYLFLRRGVVCAIGGGVSMNHVLNTWHVSVDVVCGKYGEHAGNLYAGYQGEGYSLSALFKTFGGGAAIATSSMATELIKGKTVDEALQLTNKAVVEALDGLPAHKVHCSVLAEEAIKNALKDYFDRNNIPYDPEQFKETDHDELHAQVHGE